MRTNSKKPTMVLESLPVKTRFILSMEEELMVADNANADAETVRRTLDQAERTLETSDALSDLAETASRIEEATPGEVELIDRVTQTAVAGTAVDSERIAPAMEQYIGKKIATEGIAEVARKMLDVILAAVKKVYEKIASFFSQGVVIPAQIKRIDELIVRIKNAKGAPVAKASPGENSASALQVGGKNDLTPAAISKQMQLMMNTFNYMDGEYGRIVVERGQCIVKALNDFTPATAESVVSTMIANPSMKIFPQIPQSSKSKDSEDAVIMNGPSLFGNYQLRYVYYNVADLDPIQALERMRGSVVYMHPDYEDSNGDVTEATYSPQDMVRVLEECKALLTSLMGYPKSSNSVSMKKNAAEIQAASVKLAASMKDAAGEGDTTHAEAYYKALISYNIGYAKWMEQPAIVFYRTSMNAVRALAHMIGQMLGEAPAAKE